MNHVEPSKQLSFPPALIFTLVALSLFLKETDTKTTWSQCKQNVWLKSCVIYTRAEIALDFSGGQDFTQFPENNDPFPKGMKGM